MLISLNIPELLPATNCESSTQHLQSFFHHEEAGPGSRTWTVLAGPFPADHRPITSWSIALFLEPSDGLALTGMAMSSQQRQLSLSSHRYVCGSGSYLLQAKPGSSTLAFEPDLTENMLKSNLILSTEANVRLCPGFFLLPSAIS